jgi:hypothetical protein
MVYFQTKNPSLGKFYGQMVYFMVIWHIRWSFGIFFPVLVCCTEKNLATLPQTVNHKEGVSMHAISQTCFSVK